MIPQVGSFVCWFKVIHILCLEEVYLTETLVNEIPSIKVFCDFNHNFAYEYNRHTIWIITKVYICGILFSVINTMITIVSLMSLIPECFWPDINRNKKYNSSVFCSLHNKSESNKVRQNVWKWMVEKEVLLFWAALSICLKTRFLQSDKTNLDI